MSVSTERRRMPVERRSLTTKVTISPPEGGEFSLYVTAGMYDDGSLGEIFCRDIGKEGSTIQGLLDAYATMFSVALQYGANLETLVRKFSQMKFPPNGRTDDPEIPYCSSVIDYLVRWMGHRFGDDALRAYLAETAEEGA